MSDVPPLLLTADELHALTGYRQPSAQLAELTKRGFTRARRPRGSGPVVLERLHFEAVTSDSSKQHGPEQTEPAGPNVTAFQQWAQNRKAPRGQKTQG